MNPKCNFRLYLDILGGKFLGQEKGDEEWVDVATIVVAIAAVLAWAAVSLRGKAHNQ